MLFSQYLGFAVAFLSLSAMPARAQKCEVLVPPIEKSEVDPSAETVWRLG